VNVLSGSTGYDANGDKRREQYWSFIRSYHPDVPADAIVMEKLPALLSFELTGAVPKHFQLIDVPAVTNVGFGPRISENSPWTPRPSCDVPDQLIQQLVRLPNLTEIHFNQVNLSPEGWRFLVEYPKLRSLTVWGSNLTNEDVAGWGHHFERLDLVRTKVTRLIFEDYPELASLSLSHCSLAHVSLRGLPNLQGLYLAHTNADDSWLDDLPNWKHLRGLNVTGTQVTPGVLRHIATLPEFGMLYWNGRAMDKSAIDAFIRATLSEKLP
jgi:hypothetical protein